jgi:hypothetical protein
MKEVLNGDLLCSGERWATLEEVEAFWTDERLLIAECVYEKINWRLMEEFDGPEALPFSPKAILLTATEDSEKHDTSGAHHRQSGWIMVNIHSINSSSNPDLWLAEVVAHEVGESRASRLSNYGSEFTFMDESVIETVTQRLLYEEWPQLKDDPDPVTYGLARSATTEMCKHIFRKLPDKFAYPHEVFDLLKHTVFEGDREEFFEVFSQAYGEDSFEYLHELATMPGGWSRRNLLSNKYGNEEKYKWLLKFLRGEEFDLSDTRDVISLKINEYRELEVRLEEAEERRKAAYEKQKLELEKTKAYRLGVVDGEGRLAMDRFIVGNNIVEVDYTNVPEDILIDDFTDVKSYGKRGVRAVVSDTMNYVHSRLNGQKAFGEILHIGIPQARGSYTPDENHILTRKIKDAAHDLLASAFDVGEEPEYEYMHAKDNSKVEVHKSSLSNISEEGLNVYFIYVYKTQKVYKKDERRVKRETANVAIRVLRQEEIEDWARDRKLWY